MLQVVKKSLIAFALLFISNSIMAQKKINDSWIDWANFKKYEADNNKIEPPIKTETRVVFMGNSIFEGWIRLRPELFSGKPYFDRGISGQTTPQMLLRMYDDVIALQPDIMVLKAGINDIAENTGPSTVKMISDNIISMADLAKINGINVIISSILPAKSFPWNPGINPPPKISAVNKIIEQYAKENGMIYLDYYSSMVDKNNALIEDYGSDSVHPNKKGYKVMSVLAEKAIYKILNQN